MQIKCECGKTVDIASGRLGRRKYCSKECMYKFRAVGCNKGLKYKKHKENPTSFKKGHIPWNIGTIGIVKANIGSFKGGERRSIKTEFKKGQTMGYKNINWKGNNVGYYSLHAWVYRTLGRPQKCGNCDSERNLHWANISGKYFRDRNDWKSLCPVCHRKFDEITKLSKEEANEIKKRYYSGEKQVVLANDFGITQGTISNIIRDKIKFYA